MPQTKRQSKIKIDLKGPQGNAFTLLSIAKDLSIKYVMPWDMIYTELTANDYNNLVKTMTKYFGKYITLKNNTYL